MAGVRNPYFVNSAPVFDLKRRQFRFINATASAIVKKNVRSALLEFGVNAGSHSSLRQCNFVVVKLFIPVVFPFYKHKKKKKKTKKNQNKKKPKPKKRQQKKNQKKTQQKKTNTKKPTRQRKKQKKKKNKKKPKTKKKKKISNAV